MESKKLLQYIVMYLVSLTSRMLTWFQKRSIIFILVRTVILNSSQFSVLLSVLSSA